MAGERSALGLAAEVGDRLAGVFGLAGAFHDDGAASAGVGDAGYGAVVHQALAAGDDGARRVVGVAAYVGVADARDRFHGVWLMLVSARFFLGALFAQRQGFVDGQIEGVDLGGAGAAHGDVAFEFDGGGR